MTNEEAYSKCKIIEKLKEDYNKFIDDYGLLCDDFVSVCEENEKLKSENERLASDNAWLVLNKSEKEIENVDLIEENDKLKADNEMLEMVRNKQNDVLLQEIELLKSELQNSISIPYPVGTPIFFAYPKLGVVQDRIRRWQLNNKGLMFCSKGSAYYPDAIGKSVFLAYEEAEQSLKKEGADS